jgi:cellobiose phosphorylase
LHSWFTGAASWMLQTVLKWVLGARWAYDGLLIDPCRPSGWGHCAVCRRSHGTRYHTTIQRETGNAKGMCRRVVDGKAVEGRVIPVHPGVGARKVKVTL